MYKTLMTTLFIVFPILLIAPTMAFGQPNISSTSGTVSHGEMLTIQGTGFGAKNPAAPLVWADFEQGMSPTNLGLRTSWSQIVNMGSSTECPSDAAGTGCAKATDGSGPWALRIDYSNWTNEGQKVYIYRNQRKNFLITETVSQNWKIWRMWPPLGSTNYPNIYAASNNGRVYVELIGQESGYYGNFRTGTTDWVTEELIFQASSALNVKNGLLQIRYDGVQKASGTILTRSSVSPAYMTRNYVVHGVKAAFSGWNTNNRMWVDDVYVDTTWARVMLGNAPIYSNCTNFAPQIPSGWADTLITVSVNHGPLANLSNRYLYVIDANGNVNANGYPLDAVGSLQSPTNLAVQ